VGTLPHLIRLSPGGLLNFNVAEHRLKVTPELDGKSKRPLMIVASRYNDRKGYVLTSHFHQIQFQQGILMHGLKLRASDG